jgi:uncharacterized membrane protein YfcA
VIVLVALAAFLIGFGKAGVAGTLGPFVTVLLALAMPADDAIGLLLPMLIFADAFAVAAHWKRWDVGLLRPLVLAALAGIGVGLVVVARVDAETLRTIIAIITLAFALSYGIVRRYTPPPEAVNRFGWGAGAASGLTSTLAHLGGPPIVMYLLAARVPPRTFVATTVVFFAVVNLIKVPGYVVADLFDVELIRSTMAAWLFVPVGVGLGRLMVDRIDRVLFERITLVLLAAGAVVLLVV